MVKKVRFAEHLTSSSNIKHVESSKTSNSNTHVLSPTGLKCSTSNCGSKPTGNKRNDRITQTPSRNIKNKVEAQPRKVNKKNRMVVTIHDVDDKCEFYLCCSVKSAKKHIKQNIWKPTGHIFTKVGLKWKPTCRTFTIVGNSFTLTRITSANVMPPKKTTFDSVETQKPELKVYSRKPKNIKNVGSSKKVKIVESKNANKSKPNHTWGSNATDIPPSSFLIMIGCPDCSLVYGLQMFKTYDREPLSAHELYLEVAFRKNTCFIRNLEGVDLLFGSRDTNLYTISRDDMLRTSLICLLSEASKTKSWLWHRRLSHLNFGTLNKLAKDGIARGIPRFKFQKDHLCSACALGKSKKSSHQPKTEDTNQEKLYFLHMDLCGPMRVTSINGQRHFVNFMRMLASRIKDLLPALLSRKTLSKVLVAATLRAVVLDYSLVSASIDHDASSISIPSSQEQEHSPIIFQGSSLNVRQIYTPFEHLGKWTKDHPIANVIGDPSRSVSTRKQLQPDTMWCYFDTFLTSIELKNFKQAMTKPSWIDAMQE
uniref:GAG-pre-integrase domain-containing protein n=1 Tax=Tanacetum cinerariifolium TaxID=118510 RepID=A0A6L2MRG8_TANCI|nr:hypothetical protein [Tanacetum cinerariifolium]